MKKLHLKIQQIPMIMFWRLFVVCSILTLFYCEVTISNSEVKNRANIATNTHFINEVNSQSILNFQNTWDSLKMYWFIDKLKELNPNLVLPDLNDAPVKESICAQDDQSHTEVLTSLSGYIQNVQQIPSIQH
jgi:hypothetical protein